VSGLHTDRQIDQWFNRLEQDGVAAVAWFLFGDGRGALTFDPSGYVRGVVPSFWDDYHSVLSAAERHRLKVVWILTDFEIGMPIKVERGVKTFGRADLLQDSAKRKSLIREALTPILKDKNGSRQIAGWIVINEPEHLLRAGYVTENAIRAFVTEAAAEIKRFHPDQRVGLANTDLASMIQFADLNSLDFLVFHHYGANLPPPVSFVQEYLRGRLNGAGHPRPIFIGEFNWNFPPGLDLNRFVLVCREFGYAGMWPWSLRNRLNETGSAGSDTDPQFTLLDSYATSIKAIRRRQADNPSRHAVREWAVTKLKTLLEAQVQRRVMILDAVGASHNREAQENEAWAIRCQHELSKAARELNSTKEEARRAQADVDENERWASRALPAEVYNSRAGVQRSREWRDQINGQIQSIQVEIENQQHDFVTATERARMHTYLAREALAELTWLKFLAQRLADPTAVADSIDIDW
jgi:hypothetical protein